jgi:hypothetical protein
MQYAFSFVFLLLKMQKMIFLGETWPHIYIYILKEGILLFFQLKVDYFI